MNVVSNLLSNAVKFTPEGGEVKLEVGSQQSERPSTSLFPLPTSGFLLLPVRDTGIGIPEEKLPFIFDRFYQADDAHTRKGEGEGTGIGLALTKELVKLMKGEIEVKIEAGRGTVFIREAPPAAAQENQSAVNLFSTLSETGQLKPHPITVADEEKPTALIVEDNPDVARYLIACLEGKYRLEVAYNGQVGIDTALELVPDIIITDVMMPEKDGFELCDTLKRDIRTSHIPIVMLTAKADMQSKISGLQKGADAYLAKPFHEEELQVRFDKLLELRRRLQEKYSSPDFLSPMEAPAEPEPSLEDIFLQEVHRQVEEHLDDPGMDVSKLCRLMAMSRTQLHRKLTALTGMSANRFIRSIRLNKARELLRNPNLSITEVAFDCGFSTLNYFSRAFSDMFGMSPTEYRERLN
ncbi:MAG: helix-turn-helix domain-containing protein [Phaeodactylibacter sp.]|nr:helix-turn-helix domain-containing protein [Phaeodactylibacter sp.]